MVLGLQLEMAGMAGRGKTQSFDRVKEESQNG